MEPGGCGGPLSLLQELALAGEGVEAMEGVEAGKGAKAREGVEAREAGICGLQAELSLQDDSFLREVVEVRGYSKYSYETLVQLLQDAKNTRKSKSENYFKKFIQDSCYDDARIFFQHFSTLLSVQSNQLIWLST